MFADIHTNEIMAFELGLKYHNIMRTKNGYFIGHNAPYDPQIRNLECVNTGFNDIRRHNGSRKVILDDLMIENKGKIDIHVAKQIISNHYDVYLNKINPCSRTCCSHYELDERAFMSQADRPKPYQLRGALDGIVCDTTLAKNISLIARWGTSCGTPFETKPFFKQHIQWRDQEPYVKDRPYQPWTEFRLENYKTSKNKTKMKIDKLMKIKNGNKKTKKLL
jgi:hypothetical protein